MTDIYDKFNIDFSELNNLLKDVVAYVEVRIGSDDVSNEISREIKELGAIISKSRNCKVTHVIFRNGTLRTSNWAKKHEIPLVGLGWIATCVKYKTNLLSRPWHINYMSAEVDIYGMAKRRPYKKYFKNMNVEEYKLQMERIKERRNKQIEKSINGSKSDNSINVDSPEICQSVKLRRPPTPEIVRRYKERLNRFKKIGRYSWESSNSDETELKESGNNEVIIKSKENNLTESITSHSPLKEKVNPGVNTDADDSNNKIPDLKSVENPRKIIKSHRLFRQINVISDNLIDPIREGQNFDRLKNILPMAVQKGLQSIPRKPQKRKYSIFKKESQSNSFQVSFESFDLTLPKRKSIRCVNDNKFESTSTPLTNNLHLKSGVVSKISLSPLVTEISSPMINKNSFYTPKVKKRFSLRTSILKKSTKKKYKMSLGNPSLSHDLDILNNSSINMLPETIDMDCLKVENKTESMFEAGISIPGLLKLSTNNNDSINSSTICELFDTPNLSKMLDEIIPNRQKPRNVNQILFIPKDCYDHYSRAIPPNFQDQKNCVTQKISHPDKKDLETNFGNILNFSQSDYILNCKEFESKMAQKQIRSKNISENEEKLKFARDKSSLKSLKAESKIIDKKSNSETKSRISSIKSVTDSTDVPNPVKLDQDELTTRKFINRPSRTIKVSEITIENSALKSNFIFTGSSNKLEMKNPKADIFKFSDMSLISSLVNSESKIIGQSDVVNKLEQSSNKNNSTSRKRPWSNVEKVKTKKEEALKPKRFKKTRDSTDDFILNPKLILNSKIVPSFTKSNSELVFVGFSTERHVEIKNLFRKIPHSFQFADIVRSKDQIIIVPENPRRTIEMIKAFVFGNIFVSVNWIHKSIESKKWLNFTNFLVKDMDMIECLDMQIVSSTNESLFSGYSNMYLSSLANGLHKYKLRIIIEMSGGTVTNSFRQAGIVINTRKVNALSVKESWILDSVKEGRVMDTTKYLII